MKHLDLEEKKKMIEAEHNAAELNGAPLDNFENRPSFTRKLRRRQNDPVCEKFCSLRSFPFEKERLSATDTGVT